MATLRLSGAIEPDTLRPSVTFLMLCWLGEPSSLVPVFTGEGFHAEFAFRDPRASGGPASGGETTVEGASLEVGVGTAGHAHYDNSWLTPTTRGTVRLSRVTDRNVAGEFWTRVWLPPPSSDTTSILLEGEFQGPLPTACMPMH